MQQSSIPTKFPLIWGANAGGTYIRSIPTSSQIGIQNGAASLNDGFPPDCFTAVGAGGVPPFGQDFNGILNQMTAWLQWAQAGASIPYDATFSSAIGGYPNGAVVRSVIVPSNFYISTNDNNTNNPDAYPLPSGWAQWGLGTVSKQFRETQESLDGWIVDNGTTIGSASSGASQRANADCALIYSWYWTNFSNAQCPVTGGRGGSASADFTANKPIATLQLQGTMITGMDTMGGTATTLLASVPVISGSNILPGSVLGENTHVLTIPELAPHTHTMPGSPTFLSSNGGPSGTTGSGFAFAALPTTNSAGSGTAHNNVARTILGTWYRKI